MLMHELIPLCHEHPVPRTALLPFGNAGHVHKAAFTAAHCRPPRITHAGRKYIAFPFFVSFFIFFTNPIFGPV